MLTKEDLEILREIMKEELEPINKRLDRVDETRDSIKEDLSEVRGATNYIAEWVEGLEKKVDRAM